MSTMISTQERATPLVLDANVESTGNVFSGIADFIGEIGYCLKLSVQSLTFNAMASRSSSASRADNWPVDLWVF